MAEGVIRQSRRWRRPWGAVVLVAAITAVEWVTSTWPGTYAWLVRHGCMTGPALAHGQVYRLFTSPLVQAHPGFEGFVLPIAVAIVPLHDVLRGPVRTLSVFFIGDWVSTLGGMATLAAAAAAGSDHAQALLREPDSGSSAGVAAMAGALVALSPRALRGPAAAAVLAFFAWRIVRVDQYADWEHVGAFAAGAALTVLADRRAVARRGISPDGRT